ncbi:MAG: flagellar motor protein MotA [Deltaproteobacteria bacterium HGW-Deltaproteobacteria-14]|jgi:biopolymer transport protein ExbB/TolQ|nr:MAG: flagellar motor protein MotA [Deltaproteobacteria bacterium HGW-Deltaproteobacteria-14]
MEDLKAWFDKGGPMMWVILGLSIIGWIIFVERAFVLYWMHRLASGAFISRVIALVKKRRFREALDGCNLKTRHPVVKTMRAGLLRADRRVSEIERGMEKEMLDALPEMQKRIGFLAVLANSATLLGLLGTIFGLIKAFNSVANADATARQMELTSGISEAMYTTALGITVAVPLLFFHHFLTRRSEEILEEVERGATSLVVALGGDPEASSPPPPEVAPVGAATDAVPA